MSNFVGFPKAAWLQPTRRVVRRRRSRHKSLFHRSIFSTTRQTRTKHISMHQKSESFRSTSFHREQFEIRWAKEQKKLHKLIYNRPDIIIIIFTLASTIKFSPKNRRDSRSYITIRMEWMILCANKKHETQMRCGWVIIARPFFWLTSFQCCFVSFIRKIFSAVYFDVASRIKNDLVRLISREF